MTRRSLGSAVVSALLVLFSAGLASGQGQNTANGGGALQLNSSGDSNTAVGFQRGIQTPVDVVPGFHDAIDPIEFRERLMGWALASERAFGRGMNLSEKIAVLSDEQLTIWLSTIEEPDAFLRSTERVTSRLREPGAWRRGESAPQRVETQSATALTTPFPPDYPPGSGPYNAVILGAMAAFGIGASNTNGCDASDWADYVAVWWPLNKTFDALDGACVVAGCDPTGVACFVACGVLEAAKVALKVAAVPLEACEVHGGAVEGAEIEATYENTLGLVGDVAHVHGDLATHDASISSQLSTHDTSVKALLANLQGGVSENQRLIKIFMSRQLEIMRLLITVARSTRTF